MDRRTMLSDGLRYLARMLPAMVGTAGSLGVLLPRSREAAIERCAACFPPRTEEMVPPTATPLPKEE